MKAALVYGQTFRERDAVLCIAETRDVHVAKLAGEDWWVVYVVPSCKVASPGAVPYSQAEPQDVPISWYNQLFDIGRLLRLPRIYPSWVLCVFEEV